MIGKLDMTGRTIYENTAIAKLNKVIDVVNRLEESVQGVVNNSIADGGRIQGLKEKLDAVVNMVNIHEGEIDKLQMKVEPEKLSQFVNAADLEKQALDYKAENIALSGDLERTRKALDVAVDALKYANKCIKGGCVIWKTEIDKALEQITALEQKDK